MHSSGQIIISFPLEGFTCNSYTQWVEGSEMPSGKGGGTWCFVSSGVCLIKGTEVILQPLVHDLLRSTEGGSLQKGMLG